MTFAEIKIQALKLMFTSYEDDLKPEDLSEKHFDPNYKSYLVNMNGAINRCLADIERRRVLSPRVCVIDADKLTHGKFHPRFSLDDIPDFFDVESVICEREDGMIGACPWRREGNTLILNDYRSDAEYRLLYHRKIEPITDADDSGVVDLPSAIVAAIPYFVKGDLFREDNEDEASVARNWYEATMSGVETPSSGVQTRVKSVYTQV